MANSFINAQILSLSLSIALRIVILILYGFECCIIVYSLTKYW
jgi:hypothetical protein